MVKRYLASSIGISLFTVLFAQAGQAAEYIEKTYILEERRTVPVKEIMEKVETGPGVAEYHYGYVVPTTVVTKKPIADSFVTERTVVVEKPVIVERTVERPVFIPIIDRPLTAIERDRLGRDPIVIERTVEKPVIIKQRSDRHLLHIGLPLVNINAL